MYKNKWILIAILTIVISCKREEQVANLIKIDVPDMALSSIDDFFSVDTIHLEATSSSLIGAVSRVLFWKDNLLIGDFVNGKLSMFSKEGHFISDIGKKGQGPDEYTNIHDFFVSNDTLNIYDFYRGRMLQYSMDGTFLGQRNVGSFSFDRIVPLEDNEGYVALSTFSNKKDNPKFGWLDNDLNIVAVSSEQRQNGASLPNMFFVNKKEVVYWEMMNNVIYSVSNGNVCPLYKIDFLNYNIPDDITDLNQRIEYYAANSSTTAGFINNVINTDSLLAFTFVHNLCTYWTVYDKKNGKSLFFQLAKNGEMDKLQYVSTIYENSFLGVYFPDHLRTDNNPSIIKLKFK